MKIHARLLIISLLALFSFIVWLPQWPSATEAECSCLKVSFLDIGQGDAILIETPDKYQMLIDGGPDAGVLRKLGEELSFWDRTIDVVVATHPDLDHIGGLPDVFARYDVGAYLETTNINDTSAAVALATAVAAEEIKQLYAEAGQVIHLGSDVFLQILAPHGDETNWESNNASIVMRLVYKNTAVMLTGDASAGIEGYLVSLYGEQLESDVLKLGHHGSKTSTSEEFLAAVDPQFAVVSAGLDNRYGHPNQDVMERVFDQNIQVSHTGTDGTVTYISDGQTVWQE